MCLCSPGIDNPRADVYSSLLSEHLKAPHVRPLLTGRAGSRVPTGHSAMLSFCSSEVQSSALISLPQADLALELGGASLELGATSHPAPRDQSDFPALSHPAPRALIHGRGPCRGLTPAVNFLLP